MDDHREIEFARQTELRDENRLLHGWLKRVPVIVQSDFANRDHASSGLCHKLSQRVHRLGAVTAGVIWMKPNGRHHIRPSLRQCCRASAAVQVIRWVEKTRDADRVGACEHGLAIGVEFLGVEMTVRVEQRNPLGQTRLAVARCGLLLFNAHGYFTLASLTPSSSSLATWLFLVVSQYTRISGSVPLMRISSQLPSSRMNL